MLTLFPGLPGLFFALLVFAPAPLAAQEDGAAPGLSAVDAVYVELGGNGVLYTLNYDRRLSENVSGRVGLMIIGGSGTTSDGGSGEATLAFVPVMINGLIGGGSSRLELGLGPLFAAASGQGTTVEGAEVGVSGFGLAGVTSTFGYRYQPLDGGLVFRVGLTPVYSDGPQLWAGLSLGYAF